MSNAAETTALKADQLPQYLASLGLDPQQLTTVLYGLFREIRQQKALTPGDDNTIHLTKEKLIKMGKDPLLQSSLYSLFLKVQKAKSFDVIFKNDAISQNLTAPDLWHNPSGTKSILPDADEIKDSVEIFDFVKFVSACGIDSNLVKKALEEKILLKGEK